jgi:hypothetical protein
MKRVNSKQMDVQWWKARPINKNGDVMVLFRDRHFTDATFYNNINQHSHECL